MVLQRTALLPSLGLVLSGLAFGQLQAEYYNGTGFQSLALERMDPVVDFDWGSGSPGPGVNADNFSVRWTTEVVPATSETFTFRTFTDDGARLWVDGALVIDDWTTHGPEERVGTRNLTAGAPVTVVYEYFEQGGGAVARLEWESASMPRQLLRSGGPTGVSSAGPIGPFLDGALPGGTPGTSSGNWILQDAFPNLRFKDPLTFTPEPGTNRLFVGSRQGVIESFLNSAGTTTKEPFLDLSDTCAVVWDGGFLGHAFHPEWGNPSSPNRNYFYVYYCYADPGTEIPTNFSDSQSAYFFDCYLRLSRFERFEGQNVADPNSEQIMINVRLFNGSHRGGGMFFRNDGFLYVSIGDQFRYTTAQNLSDNFEGGILRIDVDRQGRGVSHAPRRRMGVDAGFGEEVSGVGYYIPNDNPFLDTGGGLFEEFWTLGHRNPHRMTLDVQTQRIWSGEIGGSKREEINVIEGGNNYQWPFREGNVNGNYSPPANVIGNEQPPVLDFLRTEANAIVGGYVYRGTQFPELYGQYLCGDYGQQRIWALNYNVSSNTATKNYLLNFTPGSLCTFGQDHTGEVFLCGLGNNVPIRKLGRDAGYPEAPQLLSQTGAFADLANLVPRQGLIPYDVNSSLWTDGALKQRWLSVPNDGNPDTPAERIAYSEEGEWGFPEGSVLVKHFETPEGQRLETRFFVHGADGWYGVTYRWDPSGNDAQLLTNGLSENVVIGGQNVEYSYPSRTDCLTCHNMQAGSVLGVKTRQLNRDFTYPESGVVDNQLRSLSALGLLDTTVTLADLPDKRANAALDDANADLELRLRSYLDANCAQCHRPGQGHSTIDARATQSLPYQGIVAGGVTDDLGIPGARVIAPGDTSRSILFQRISSTEGCCAMPPLGSGLVDAQAIALLEQWINGLDPAAQTGSVSQSSTAFDGPAINAIDVALEGLHNGGNGPGPVTHTANESQPFWDTDMGTEFFLERVRLWNRVDCCADRLSNFWVLLSPDPFVGPALSDGLNQAGVTATHFPGTVDRETFVDLNGAGRYLRVQKADFGILSLAEVQLFGQTNGGGGGNTPPVVDAGPDRTAELNNPILLQGQVTDDGEPDVLWSKVSGPGGVNFGLIFSSQSTAIFYVPGTYVLRLTANDGQFQAYDELTVEVSSINDPPVVDAGANFSAPLDAAVDLDGTVTDDSFFFSTSWEKVSGPGGVNFTMIWKPDSPAIFYVAGTYVLRLTATDGEHTVSDLVTVTAGQAGNSPPNVDAGPDFTTVTNQPYGLQGSVNDDSPSVDVAWSKVSGPGGVNFLSIWSPTSDAIFYVPGTYVLRLSADDGEHNVSDEVTVVIN